MNATYLTHLTSILEYKMLTNANGFGIEFGERPLFVSNERKTKWGKKTKTKKEMKKKERGI